MLLLRMPPPPFLSDISVSEEPSCVGWNSCGTIITVALNRVRDEGMEEGKRGERKERGEVGIGE